MRKSRITDSDTAYSIGWIEGSVFDNSSVAGQTNGAYEHGGPGRYELASGETSTRRVSDPITRAVDGWAGYFIAVCFRLHIDVASMMPVAKH